MLGEGLIFAKSRDDRWETEVSSGQMEDISALPRSLIFMQRYQGITEGFLNKA